MRWPSEAYSRPAPSCKTRQPNQSRPAFDSLMRRRGTQWACISIAISVSTLCRSPLTARKLAPPRHIFGIPRVTFDAFRHRLIVSRVKDIEPGDLLGVDFLSLLCKLKALGRIAFA